MKEKEFIDAFNDHTKKIKGMNLEELMNAWDQIQTVIIIARAQREAISHRMRELRIQ